MKLAPEAFFKKYAPYAISSQQTTGVPADIALAQAALESGWGGSGLTVNANNFFGIKADKSWLGEKYPTLTKEWNGTSFITISSNFRKYDSPKGSFDDHGFFLRKNKRYATLFNLPINDYVGWANGLKKAGYATDPDYANKLMALIAKYRLDIYVQDGIKKKNINK